MPAGGIKFRFDCASVKPIKQHIRQIFANIERGVREPRSIGPMMRGGALQLWQSRGGGLYGLGYVVTFVALEVLEIPELFRDLYALFGGGTVGLALSALLTLIVDFFVDTLKNMIFAFIWPGLLISYLDGWGVLLVALGFASFDPLLRPLIERAFPELKHARETQETKKAQKQAKKEAKKEAKKRRFKNKKQSAAD